MTRLLPIPRRRRAGAVLARAGRLAVAAVLAACSSSRSDTAADSVTAAADAPSAAITAGDSGAPGCRLEGDWTPCAIEDRLVHAGVVLTLQPDSVTHPFFQVRGAVYHVGSEEHQLQLFLYPSREARERDTAQLDSATVSPKGSRVAWGTPPTLVTSNNLAAVILSLNDRTVERLALALGAGLPQPANR